MFKVEVLIRNGPAGYADTDYEFVFFDEMLTPDDFMRCQRDTVRKYSHVRYSRIHEISYVSRKPDSPPTFVPKEFLNQFQTGDFSNFLSVIFSLMDQSEECTCGEMNT